MSQDTREYGLSPLLRARLMGVFLGLLGVLLVIVTVVIVVLNASTVYLGVAVVATIAGVFGVGFLLVRRWSVVTFDATGYQVRFVRGVGVDRARWPDVEDLATAVAAGTECVVLRLRSGQTTTIPVNLIEGDREEFVDELRRRLEAGNGRRGTRG